MTTLAFDMKENDILGTHLVQTFCSSLSSIHNVYNRLKHLRKREIC